MTKFETYSGAFPNAALRRKANGVLEVYAAWSTKARDMDWRWKASAPPRSPAPAPRPSARTR
jgi:hypothetical protein